jgi:cytochrome bd ubiquinol oxidase subunit II
LRTVWFSWPNILILSPVPVATALVAWATWRALGGASQAGGFIGAVGLFALSYIGGTISLFPMIVPHHYTLMQAASPPGTQAFLLVGTLFLLPVIFFCSGWSYWVSAARCAPMWAIIELQARGRVRAAENV